MPVFESFVGLEPEIEEASFNYLDLTPFKDGYKYNSKGILAIKEGIVIYKGNDKIIVKNNNQNYIYHGIKSQCHLYEKINVNTFLGTAINEAVYVKVTYEN